MKSSTHRIERKKGHQGRQRQVSDHSVSEESLNTKYGEVLTTEEAADYLRVSVGMLRVMVCEGLIPYTKLGNRNRYFLHELRELLLSNRRGGGRDGQGGDRQT